MQHTAKLGQLAWLVVTCGGVRRISAPRSWGLQSTYLLYAWPTSSCCHPAPPPLCHPPPPNVMFSVSNRARGRTHSEGMYVMISLALCFQLSLSLCHLLPKSRIFLPQQLYDITCTTKAAHSQVRPAGPPGWL
jgi:hypothetical protein